jgi:hypothetical protein
VNFLDGCTFSKAAANAGMGFKGAPLFKEPSAILLVFSTSEFEVHLFPFKHYHYFFETPPEQISYLELVFS